MNNGENVIDETLLSLCVQYFLTDFSDFLRSIWSEIKAVSGEATTSQLSLLCPRKWDLYSKSTVMFRDVVVSRGLALTLTFVLDLVKKIQKSE